MSDFGRNENCRCSLLRRLTEVAQLAGGGASGARVITAHERPPRCLEPPGRGSYGDAIAQIPIRLYENHFAYLCWSTPLRPSGKRHSPQGMSLRTICFVAEPIL